MTVAAWVDDCYCRVSAECDDNRTFTGAQTACMHAPARHGGLASPIYCMRATLAQFAAARYRMSVVRRA